MISDIKKRRHMVGWAQDPEVQKELEACEKYLEEQKKLIYKKII